MTLTSNPEDLDTPTEPQTEPCHPTEMTPGPSLASLLPLIGKNSDPRLRRP